MNRPSLLLLLLFFFFGVMVELFVAVAAAGTVIVIVVVCGDRDDGMLRMEGGKAEEVQNKSNIPVTPKMKFSPFEKAFERHFTSH